MRCPYCDRSGPRQELHAHLTEDHGDKVITEQDAWGRRFIELQCPACAQGHRQAGKPGYHDPQFLDEHVREIRIVAFDLFLYHWEDQHDREATDE